MICFYIYEQGSSNTVQINMAMVPPFRKILIPADFTSNTEVAVQKAIELIQPHQSVLGLLHCMKPLWSFNIFSSTGYFIAPASEILTESEVENVMEQYALRIKEVLPDVDIRKIICTRGRVQKNIIQAIKELSPDLIIIGKRGGRRFINFSNLVDPGKIARKTGCPVLTIKRGSIAGKIKNIVLPVATRVPERKLDIAVGIAKSGL